MDHESGDCDEFEETHEMRYLFDEEIRGFADRAGFDLLDSREWLSDGIPGKDTWSVYSVARVRG